MRSTRGLLLLAIFVILGAVGVTFYRQKTNLARQAPPPPKALPENVDAAARDWVWSYSTGSHVEVKIEAKKVTQVRDRTELQDVDFRIYHKEGKEFDRITSARGELDATKGTLYSDGEVEITMGVPVDAAPSGRLVRIRTSGATFDNKTGRASTDRAARFTFDQGEGRCVGASYDPNSRELHMYSQVEVDWRGNGPGSKPMKIESGELLYKERDAAIILSPWSRLTRENTVIDASDALVFLEDGTVHRVEAKSAHGTDRYPARQLEYSADQVTMNFSPDGAAEKIVGERNARLVSSSESARTTMTTDRVDLDFDPASPDSALQSALAMGHSTLESVPLPRPGAAAAMTRVLKSQVILMRMRPGGREIDLVETHTPGRLEFLPNRPGQRHRTLEGERMTIAYGPNNQVQSFRATTVSTRTDPETRPGRPPAPPVETWSKDLKAEFDPKTGQLSRLEQWNDFRYREGERQATADSAVLDEAQNRITLDRHARAWDPAGSTTADQLLLDQKSGEMTALGHVVSTRLPDHKGTSSAMLSGDEPMDATADRMVTTDHNRHVTYEGNAVAWQGPNRIQADRIEIDRAARRLFADGHVHTQFVDSNSGSGKSRAAPAFVVVDAGSLLYTDQDRLAHYSGGAHLSRPGLDVRATEIRAFLNERKPAGAPASGNVTDSGSSVDHAFADGQVRIVAVQPGRTRTGEGEHAEYYAADQKIILEGPQAVMVDSLRGQTRGRQLTWFANDDKLLVNGAEQQPVVSRIRRQPQKAERLRINP